MIRKPKVYRSRLGLYTIGVLELYGKPCELKVLNEKWIIFKSKEKKRKRKKEKVCVSTKSIFD